MKKFFLLSIILLFAFKLEAQDMRQNAFSSLFSDQKANRVGDAVTILVIESSQASNNAQTSTNRQSDISLSGKGTVAAKAIPGADVSLGTGNGFKGSGSTATHGMVQTKISATIDSVLPNGNLHIKGSRKIVINGEEQTVFIKGIVRTSDIRADNSVLSYNISEAEIDFNGSGMISRAQSPGWLTRFLHWIF